MTPDYYRDKAALEEMLTHLPPNGSLTADQADKKAELQKLLADAHAAGDQTLRQKLCALRDAHETFLGGSNDVKRQVGKGLRAAGLTGAANGLCSLLERLWAETEDGAKTTDQFISDLRHAFGKSSNGAPTQLKKFICHAASAGDQVEAFCTVMKRPFKGTSVILVGSAIDALLSAAEGNGLPAPYVRTLKSLREAVRAAGGGGEGDPYWPSTYVYSSSSSSSSGGG
jgi:hypothetical protein